MSKTDGKPRNFKELLSKFRDQKATTKNKIKEVAPEIAEDILQTGEAFVEIVKESPIIAKEMAQRGLETQVERIDTEFGKINARTVNSRESIDQINQRKDKEQSNWQGKNQKRGDFLKDSVGAVSRGESAVRNLEADAIVKGAGVAAKATAVFGLGKQGKKVQEAAEKKAQEIVNDSRTTKKATKAVESVWAAQDRAQGVANRTKNANTTFKSRVNKAEERQAQEAKENNRSQRGENFVKGVGKVGLKFRSLYQKVEMGVQGKVGAVRAATFKAQKEDVKRAQKATLKRHEKGLQSPREVKVAQGIMNGIYYMQDRAGDVRQWTSDKVNNAKKWTNDKVDDVKQWTGDRVQDVKDGIDAAYVYADDAKKAVVNKKDDIVLTAMEGAEKASKAVKSAKETAAIHAMMAGDAAKDKIITIADAGMGVATTTAAFAELAGESIVNGTKYVAGKAQEKANGVKESVVKGAKETAQKVSETESKAKRGFFKGLSTMGHSILSKISNGVKSIDAQYLASELEVAAKQTTPEKLNQQQQDARQEEPDL